MGMGRRPAWRTPPSRRNIVEVDEIMVGVWLVGSAWMLTIMGLIHALV
jgi:hypothetical protein